MLCLDGEKFMKEWIFPLYKYGNLLHFNLIRNCNLKLHVRWLVNLIKQNNKLGETSSKCRSWDMNKLLQNYDIFTFLRSVLGWNVLKTPFLWQKKNLCTISSKDELVKQFNPSYKTQMGNDTINQQNAPWSKRFLGNLQKSTRFKWKKFGFCPKFQLTT